MAWGRDSRGRGHCQMCKTGAGREENAAEWSSTPSAGWHHAVTGWHHTVAGWHHTVTGGRADSASRASPAVSGQAAPTCSSRQCPDRLMWRARAAWT